MHVSNFRDIKNGQVFNPSYGKITVDAMMEAIRGQSGIRTLQIGGRTMTDKTLEAAAHLTGLEELFLWWANKITDAGIARIQHLPHLRKLSIGYSRSSDVAVDHLAHLPMLEELEIDGPGFTDRSLLALSKVSRLKALTLSSRHPHITDEGIEPLHRLAHLRQLHLPNAGISPQAWERLRQALPHLELIP